MSTKLQKIVIDTNSSMNRTHSGFFGFRDDLQRFAEVSELIFPKIVLDEIKAQKSRLLVEKRSKILVNPFMELADLPKSKIEDYDIDTLIDKTLSSEAIPFQLVELEDANQAFKKMYEWAIKNEAPFGVDNDKGFKDAYIACVLYELLNKHDDECIFLCTKDERLALTFKSDPRVQVIQGFQDFQSYSLGAFLDDYLRTKISEELELKDYEIKDGWLNVDSNWVLRLSADNSETLVVIDSEAREIITHTDEDVDEHIKRLEVSMNFQNTHSAIAGLSQFTAYLSKVQIEAIMRASTENDQIYWIATDEDVKSLLLPLFEYIKPTIDEDIVKKFEGYFEVAYD